MSVNEHTRLLRSNHKDKDPPPQTTVGKQPSSMSNTRKSVIVYVLFVAYIALNSFGASCITQMVYDLVSNDDQFIREAIYDEKHRHLHSNSSQNGTCSGVNSSAQENFFQETSSNWLLYFNLVEKGLCLPALILSGLYSDVYGRKPFLFISPCLHVLKYTLLAVQYHFKFQLAYMFIPYIVCGIGGSSYTFWLVTMAAIADTTKASGRTMAFAILEASMGVTGATMQVIQGYVIQLLGFDVVFFSAGGGMILLIISLYLFIPETLSVETKQGTKRNFRELMSNLPVVFNAKSKWIPESNLTTACFMIAFSLTYLVLTARSSLEILFVLGSPFCWTAVHVGFFKCIKDLAHCVFGVFFVRALQTCVRDEIIVILGTLSLTAYNAMFFFSVSDTWVYFGKYMYNDITNII